MKRTLLILAAAGSLAAAPAIWPQFRGPASNPVSDNPQLPDRWSQSENIEWAAPIPGRGWSSPIVANGKIFLTTATTDGPSKAPQTGTEYSNEYAAELQQKGLSMPEIIAKLNERDFEMPDQVTLHYFLYCLNLKSGAVEWKREYYSGRPPGGRHRKNSFTSETPVTDGKSVFVFTANLGLYAFDLKGKQLWHVPVEKHPIYLEFGTAASPVLYGNQLFIISDNQEQQYLAAYDKTTGKRLWRTERDLGPPRGEMAFRSAWSTPFVWTNAIRTEIVTVGPTVAVSYDLEGKELWRMKGPAPAPIPSPFAVDGLLILNAGRGSQLFAIKPGAKGDISLAKGEKSNEFIAWTDARGGTYLPTPVAYREAIYNLTETGILTRLEIQTGKVSYRARLGVDAGYFTTSPWAYNGKVFFLSEDGKTFVIDAGSEFKLLHTNELGEFSMATPALVEGRLLLRTQEKLYSIRSRSRDIKTSAAPNKNGEE